MHKNHKSCKGNCECSCHKKLTITSSRKDVADELKAKRNKYNLFKNQACLFIGYGVHPSTYARLENAKPTSVEVFHYAREWANKADLK